MRFKNIDDVEEILEESLGKILLLEEIEYALSTSEKEEIYSFIARMHDIDLSEKEEKGEE